MVRENNNFRDKTFFVVTVFHACVVLYAVLIAHDEVPNQLYITSDKLDKLWYDFKPCDNCQNEKVTISL